MNFTDTDALHLPSSGKSHHITGIILRLDSLHPRKGISENLLHRRARCRIVAVQRRVRDVLAFADSHRKKLLRALGRRRVHGVVRELRAPCKVDVERKEPLGTRRRVRRSGSGAVGKEGGQEGFDVVRDERG